LWFFVLDLFKYTGRGNQIHMEGEEAMSEILAVKGQYRFVLREDGIYAIEYLSDSRKFTVRQGRDKAEIEEVFNKLRVLKKPQEAATSRGK
jgi:hypothetical protein